MRAVSVLALLVVAAGNAWAQESLPSFARPVAPEPAAPTTAPAPAATPAPKDTAKVPKGTEFIQGDPGEVADRILQQLTLRARIAQMMIVMPEGRRSPTTEDLAYLKEFPPGAIIVRQLIKPSNAAYYVTKLRELEAGTGVPVLIGADLYSLSRRDREAQSAFMQVPSLLSIGATADEESARQVANIIATQMKGMGFDFYVGPPLQLAPSLATAPGSIHCFGSDAQFAGRATAAMSEVFAEQGLLLMPVGFPGGGLNRSAKEPAVLLTPKPLLAVRDLAPFELAIDGGVGLIHVGTTLVPTLDAASPPACLSLEVIGGLLRGDLDYRGVVVAGPLDSLDVVQRVGPTEAAVRAIEAGADMLWWQEVGGIAPKAVLTIEDAVRTGRLSESAINASVRRILELKVRQRQGGIVPLKEVALQRLNTKKDLTNASFEIERRAITLVQNHRNILPLDKKISMPIGITGTVGVDELKTALEEYIKPISAQKIGSAKHLGRLESFEIERVTKHMRGIRTMVIVLSDATEVRGQVELLRAVRNEGVAVVVVLLGYPQNLPELAGAEAIVLAYSDSATFGETIRALADVLTGNGPVRVVDAAATPQVRVGEPRVYAVADLVRAPYGRLPVQINEHFALGLAVPYTQPEQYLRKTTWEFGTGTRLNDPNATFSFTETGRYPVTLTITDNLKETRSQTFYVEVVP